MSKDRLSDLRFAAGKRPEPVTIYVDGSPVLAYPGEALAPALLAAGVRVLRTSPNAGTARGMFCLMGVCQECLVWVDDQLVLSCQERVRAGARVETGAPL